MKDRPTSETRPLLSRARGMETIRAEGLRVETASGAPIVEDISLHVDVGEVLGMVGESGSGKTSVSLALLGMAHPGARLAAGKVITAERSVDVTDTRGIRALRGRSISYVPQSPATALNPMMRVEATLKEMLRSSAPRDGATATSPSERIAKILQKVGLPNSRDLLRRFPHQLSGGQQQRVCIAVALLSGADVMILDEPTTGLDVITQASVIDELRRLRSDLGISMIYISHDLAVVSQIADRVVVMRSGHIVEEGAVTAVLGAPEHDYTRSLVAATLDHRRPVADALTVTSEARVSNRSSSSTPALLVKNLTVEHVAHGRVVASVSDVSFRIDSGRCVALLGESGSGKSTIARSVVGLKPRKSGLISLAGVPLEPDVSKRTDDQRRRLQIVFQNSAGALNPREAVVTAVERGRSSRAQYEHQHSVAELLELVRLPSSLLHRLPRELSGGERQRVCIARALGSSPEVLVCDEITSSLDVSVQASVLKLLKELQRDLGLSLLFITHDMGVVSYVADGVVVLDGGKICESGTTTDVLQAPASQYLRRLLDAVPSLDGVTRSGDSRARSVPHGY